MDYFQLKCATCGAIVAMEGKEPTLGIALVSCADKAGGTHLVIGVRSVAIFCSESCRDKQSDSSGRLRRRFVSGDPPPLPWPKAPREAVKLPEGKGSAMVYCKRCGGLAINPHLYGREPEVDLDLCDICYWRKRAEAAQPCPSCSGTGVAPADPREDPTARRFTHDR